MTAAAPWRPSLSLSARMTLVCVAVALVAAALSGVAAARAVIQEDRIAAAAAASPAPVATTPAERARERARQRALARAEARPVQRVERAVVVALAAGLGVGLLAGGGAARLLTRPLRRTAAAATALQHGRRDVQVPAEGPPEVAEVAESLNALAAALATSEARQRRFLLSVSHELRTPLTAVQGFGESIADGVVEGAQAREAGRVVVTESQRLARLVEDLLALARMGADDFRLEPADVDLGTLLDDAFRTWSTTARARAPELPTVEVDLPTGAAELRTAGLELPTGAAELRAAGPEFPTAAPGFPTGAAELRAAGPELRVERPSAPLVVRTDPGRLRQVLDGLAANAVRMTPAGRPVVLAARPAGPADPPGAAAVLQVRDGGPGLTEADRAVAFEPGALGARYRDERPVGVGIGLSLVHGLVQRLGGGIAVGVAPEGGAAFTVVLPAMPPLAPEA